MRWMLTGVSIAIRVSHQAAMVGLGVRFDDVVDYVRSNDVGTAVVLRALARRDFRGPLVLASSMVVYGEGAYRCPAHGPVRLLGRSSRMSGSCTTEPRSSSTASATR